MKLLENDGFAIQLVGKDLTDIITASQEQIEEDLDEEVDIIIADSRYSFIATIIEKTVKKNRSSYQNAIR